MRRRRYPVLFLLLLVATACGDDGKKTAAGTTTSTSTSTTTSTSTSTTVAATTTTTARGATTTARATTTTRAPAGTVLTNAGATLEAAPQPTVQSTQGPGADCRSLGDSGFTVEGCDRVEMAGGARVWLVESKGEAPMQAQRAYVMHFSQGRGAWLVDLRFTDDRGFTVSGVRVRAGDLTGDGKPELVFGFHLFGSGAILAYDIVTDAAGGGPRVAASRQLSHGQASVTPPTIVDREAKYPNNEPNCCPAFIQVSTVSFSNGAFRAVETSRDDPLTSSGPGPGPNLL